MNTFNQVATLINEHNHASQTTETLTALYTQIGKIIALQDSANFISKLAKIIVTDCVNAKGFSPRNLRRMRDFYVTYSATPELMAQAKSLNWTQNIIIMDSCKSAEEKAFYIALAKAESLSKVALIAVISAETFTKTRKATILNNAKAKNTKTGKICPVTTGATKIASTTFAVAKSHVAPFRPKVKAILSSPPFKKPWDYWGFSSRLRRRKSCKLPFSSRLRLPNGQLKPANPMHLKC